MCGIAGIASFDVEREPNARVVQSMVDSLRHRGPDEEGIESRCGVALGIRRLSIIDVRGGSQPIANEDGSVRVVFNGEIYNYRALREELMRRGHVFSTRSDTEVIVHAYEEFGEEFLARLNGMFAIALHDVKRRKLVLARDPIGIKPLYFSILHDYVLWGSEVKAILASGLVEKELDVDALGEFLAWEYVPAPSTLIKSVRKLEPGTCIHIYLGERRVETSRFWDLRPDEDSGGRSDAEWEEVIDEHLRRSVQSQLESEVPLGAFLSGGVDSGLVVAAMGPAQTFSIGFDDPSYNELDFARRVAEHLRVAHLQETIRPDAAELFNNLVYFLDDPIGDFSIFPTYLVSQLARRHVTVALSGDGGDELFGGYETYSAGHLAERYQLVPGAIRQGMIEPVVSSLRPRSTKKGVVNKSKRFIEGMAHPAHLGHARWRIFTDDALEATLFTPDVLAQRTDHSARHIVELFRQADGFSPLNQWLYVDLKSYLGENILTKVDRMSMAVSLEARVPYLDTELVELAYRMPGRLKVNYGKTKVLLKRLAARYLPRECVYRPKQGFSIPMKTWLNGRFQPLMDEYLNDSRLNGQGIFRSDTVRRLRNEHHSGVANHSHVLWSLVVYQAWHTRWYESSAA